MCEKSTNPENRTKDNNTRKIRIEINQPKIFKLNIDCVYSILDLLSLEDVRSFGQTCRAFQQITGEYFQRNHVDFLSIGRKRFGHLNYDDWIANGFKKYLQHLFFMPELYLQRSVKKETSIAAKHYISELKHVRFYHADLSGTEIKNLCHTWNQLKTVAMIKCRVTRKFYEQFPRLCTNLERLYVVEFDCHQNVPIRTGNEWLLWKYPKLVHLHWTTLREEQISELTTFFQRNPQLRSFTTDNKTLWENRHLMMNSHIELDDLTIEIGQNKRNFHDIHNLLNDLKVQGVYKRLHFNLRHFNQQMIDDMRPLYDLNSLCLEYDSNNDGVIALPRWMNLIELQVSNYCTLINTDVLVMHWTNLNRISFHLIASHDILPFIRHSTKLKKMKIQYLSDSKNCQNILNLSNLNDEREKLHGASKVTIYVNEEVYLATKWAMNGTDFNLIEIRRASSDEWGYHFNY